MYNGTTYYYQRNGQGDIIGMYNSSGTKVVSYTYDVWGKLLTTSGSLASTLGENNPLRYRGYYYDNETGFYYLQSRYYDPTTGRFISPDVLVSTGQGVLGHNMYAYCLNNPVNMSDESGYIAKPIVVDNYYPSNIKYETCLINGRTHNLSMTVIELSYIAFGFTLMSIDTDGEVDKAHLEQAASDRYHQDTTAYRFRSGEYMNAFTMPYVVMPKNIGHGISKGDVAILINLDTMQYVMAIVGDRSAAGKTVHEVSIFAAQQVSTNAGATRGVKGNFIIRVYPGTNRNWRHNNFYRQIMQYSKIYYHER
jgi:RHS repeat-associated protein